MVDAGLPMRYFSLCMCLCACVHCGVYAYVLEAVQSASELRVHPVY